MNLIRLDPIVASSFSSYKKRLAWKIMNLKTNLVLQSENLKQIKSSFYSKKINTNLASFNNAVL